MRHKIIYTDNYALIVSDEEIKDVRPFMGKYHLEKGFIINQFPDYLTDLSECKLIIAHQPLKHDAPILEGVTLLPEFGQEDDVAELAFRTYPFGNSERNALIAGYNKAKETYKFTEDDLRKVIEASRDIRYVTYSEDEIIQSIQQPKLPQYFECEIEDTFLLKNRKGGNTIMAKPKTITNSQGQTVLVGEYIYE
jgi:hypothetical protein